ncbi:MULTISPECIES: hypothetical protein [unclassified Luteibacter]|uniref:hypothetical protein n=1 Tax=Luteibacter sp. PvP019 TaxID=3156436 RepID=UPI003394B7C7
MDLAIYLALVISVAAVTGSVIHMYCSGNPTVPFSWGVGLVAVGLLAYLCSHLGSPRLLPEETDTLRKLFIIIADIGANLLAGAAAAQNAHHSAPVGLPAAPASDATLPRILPQPRRVHSSRGRLVEYCALEPEHAESHRADHGQAESGGDDEAKSAYDGKGKEDGLLT